MSGEVRGEESCSSPFPADETLRNCVETHSLEVSLLLLYIRRRTGGGPVMSQKGSVLGVPAAAQDAAAEP